MSAASAYDVLVQPALDHCPVVLLSCAGWFALMALSHRVMSALSPTYRALPPDEQNAFGVRVAAVVHAFISWRTIPGWFDPAPEILANPFYAAHDTPTRTLSVFFEVTTGYFVWDIIVSIYYGWGVAFILHAFSSFGVFYFGLYPFLPMHGCFYLGVFEISSPWLHLRGITEQLGYTGKPIHTLLGLVFFVTFTVVRIILGCYVSFFWWLEMIALARSGFAHSVPVVVYYLVANGILMLMQLYWFTELLKAIVSGEAKDDKKKS